MKLIEKILLLFLISISIHRIDFAGGYLSFILTPTLLFSFSLIALFIFYCCYSKIIIPKDFKLFFILVFGLTLWILISILPIKDPLQTKRLILFFINIYSSIIFFILFHQVSNKEIIIKKFLNYSLIFYIIFSLFEGIVFFLVKFNLKETYTIFKFINLQPNTFGFYLPRITGGFLDPNIGSYFLTFIYLLNNYFDIKNKKFIIITILILFSFSRSAVVTFLIVACLCFIYNYIVLKKKIIIKKRISISQTAKIISFSIFILTSLIFFVNKFNIISNFKAAIIGRFSHKDESANIHFNLIKLGVNKILENYISFFKGYGFGSSFLYTHIYFPGNKYGNFHSEYITIMFETGIIGLIFYVLVQIFPLFIIFFLKKYELDLKKSKFYILLIILAMGLHNIFYQQYLFQYYWIMIGFTWYLSSNHLNKRMQSN